MSMPGKRIYFESYGCPSNRFDLELMMTSLEELGHVAVGDPESADVLVINTCGVKKATEDKILSRLRSLRGLGKPMIVAGCLPKIDLGAVERVIPDDLVLLDPFSVDKISVAVEGIEQGKLNRRFFSSEAKVKVRMPKHRSGVCEIVPISEGCLGSCTFCCTRFARGRLFSYPLEAVVRRVEELVLDGVGEIWITAQDTGAYGLDGDCDLAALLRETCKVKGKFFMRVGMMNPNNVLWTLDRLVEAYRDEKIFKFLHLPVQSGNDEVLKLMHRFYTVSDFKRIVDSFRKAIPDISLATDIICGFPGEDEEASKDSLKLIREIEPDVVNVSKFFPRPKTAAARMKQLPSQTVKERSKEMAALCKTAALKRNSRWLNWTGEVFIDEKGKGATMVGRNFAYKPIVVDGEYGLFGKLVKVRVKEIKPTYLVGELMPQ